jgi:hypothetical protein
MPSRFSFAAAFATWLALVPAMAQAQALIYFDVQAIRATCSSGGDCARVVQAAIAQIRAAGLSGAAVNRQLAVLAADVIGSSQAGGTGGTPQTAAALQSIVEAVSFAPQRDAIASAAQTLAQGGAVSVQDVAGAASPG